MHTDWNGGRTSWQSIIALISPAAESRNSLCCNKKLENPIDIKCLVRPRGNCLAFQLFPRGGSPWRVILARQG